MNVGLVGNNDGPLYLLRAMRECDLEPVCVGLQNLPSEAVQQAYASASPLHLFTGFDEDKLVERLRSMNLDLLVNAFCNFRFDRLLNQPYDALNLHLAPLPRYRGRHPLQWALINGESQFGVSIHQMTSSWDAGPVMWQQMVPVDDGMSVARLRGRLMNAVTAKFGAFLHAYARGDATPLPKNDADATYVARRFSEDSALTDWSDHAFVVRKVMALRSESYPAYLTVGDTHVTTRAAHALSRRYVGLAAPFVCGVHESSLDVVCLDGQTVRFSELQPTSPDVALNDRVKL